MKFRAAYRDIELYEPGRLPIEVDLSDNTNLFGIAPAARALFDALPDAMISRYPTVFGKALKEALAERHNVTPENIATGCGSDDLIDSAIRAFSEPGDSFAFPWPTFGVVSTFAKMNATRPLPVRSIDALTVANAAVTYVCTPNNPTGATVSEEHIRQLDRQLEGLLLLDEAYADFGDADHAQLAVRSERTVSLRTMSKAYGLAGLRIGYAIGPAAIILEIEKSRGPYKVGTVSEEIGRRVVRENEQWRKDVVAKVRENRTRLAEEINARGLRQSPSAGNFILISLPAGRNAVAVNNGLREYGVAARAFGDLPDYGECLRVTVGPWPMMEKFLNAFDAVLSR